MAASGSRGDAVREYFLECERRLLAGEPPIPGSVDVAPRPSDAAAVADLFFQPSMPASGLPCPWPPSCSSSACLRRR